MLGWRSTFIFLKIIKTSKTLSRASLRASESSRLREFLTLESIVGIGGSLMVECRDNVSQCIFYPSIIESGRGPAPGFSRFETCTQVCSQNLAEIMAGVSDPVCRFLFCMDSRARSATRGPPKLVQTFFIMLISNCSMQKKNLHYSYTIFR